jgi:hypothetical protein
MPSTSLRNLKKTKIKKLIGLAYWIFAKALSDFNLFTGLAKWSLQDYPLLRLIQTRSLSNMTVAIEI